MAEERPRKTAASRRPVTHFTVVATQARLADGSYAKQGEVVKAELFGDDAALHVEREAIRPATAEEIEPAETE